MALEALLLDARTLPDRDRLLAYTTRLDAALSALAASLRDEAPPPDLRGLREEERAIAEHLEAAAGDDQAGVAAAVTEALDRMTDSVDTLAHVLRQGARGRATPA